MFNARALCLSFWIGIFAFGSCAVAGEFVFDPKKNAAIEKTWLSNTPVYFTVPDSAWLKLPGDLDTRKFDQLIDFRHPDGIATKARPGLRIIAARREGFGAEMVRTGLIQPGDLLLWFHPDYAGSGAYFSVEMGISHLGMVYMKQEAGQNVIANIDNPLSQQGYYVNCTNVVSKKTGKTTCVSNLVDSTKFGGNYHAGAMLHVIRPRGLTDTQRATISKWANLYLNVVAKKFYGSRDRDLFNFDPHYNAPLYKPGLPLWFVQRLGQIGLTDPNAKISRARDSVPLLQMFCAEFVWSLLALRDCDPETSAADLNGRSMPACIKPIMTPLPATGHYLIGSAAAQDIGLADGPLIAIDALNKSQVDADALIDAMFAADPKKAGRDQNGLAEKLQIEFEALKPYYKAITAGGLEAFMAGIAGYGLRETVPDNYSPTAFLINSLLPADDPNRTMDYVATIKFLD